MYPFFFEVGDNISKNGRLIHSISCQLINTIKNIHKQTRRNTLIAEKSPLNPEQL